MKKTIAFIFTLLCFVVVFPAFGSPSLELYVATNGDDTAAGTVDAPFATLEKARDEIRKRKETENFSGAEVILRGGSFFDANSHRPQKRPLASRLPRSKGLP